MTDEPLDPQTIWVPLSMKIEIYWPQPPELIGLVYVNDCIVQQLSFQRIMPEDAEYGVTPGWWKMEYRYFLNDTSLIEAIKQEASKGLMDGTIKMHFHGRENL